MKDGGNITKRKQLKMLKRILKNFGKILKQKVEMEKGNNENKTMHLSVAIKTDDRHAGDSSIYRKDDEKNERILNKFGKILNKRTKAKQYFRVL